MWLLLPVVLIAFISVLSHSALSIVFFGVIVTATLLLRRQVQEVHTLQQQLEKEIEARRTDVENLNLKLAEERKRFQEELERQKEEMTAASLEVLLRSFIVMGSAQNETRNKIP
jgi:Skp family chaperone for outer membrane proteins